MIPDVQTYALIKLAAKLAKDDQRQSMHPEDIRARIDTEANEAAARSVARFTRSA